MSDDIEFIKKRVPGKGHESELTKLLKTYPNKEWSFTKLSSNPNIDINTVKAFENKVWSYYLLSKNDNIFLEDTLQSKDKNWCYEEFAIRENTPVFNTPKKYYANIIKNANNKIEAMSSWELYQLSNYPDLDFKKLGPKLSKIFIGCPLSWYALSKNPCITIETVLENRDFPWSWRALSENPRISIEDIFKHSELPWKYKYVSMNPNLTHDIVIKNLDRPWCFDYMSYNYFFKHFEMYRGYDVFYKLPGVRFLLREYINIFIKVAPHVPDDVLEVICLYIL